MSTANDKYLLGDVDGNGTITDLYSYSSKTETPTNRQYALADVDGDAQVTATDSRYILRYSSGLITKMPLYN